MVEDCDFYGSLTYYTYSPTMHAFTTQKSNKQYDVIIVLGICGFNTWGVTLQEQLEILWHVVNSKFAEAFQGGVWVSSTMLSIQILAWWQTSLMVMVVVISINWGIQAGLKDTAFPVVGRIRVVLSFWKQRQKQLSAI